MIIELITGIEIIEGEVGVGVEIGIHVTVTERGIIVTVAGVAALMVTSMGETVCLLHVEVLVVAEAEVAATVLMITRGVAETVHHLRVGALAAPHLARHHLLLRDLLSGASTMMTGLHVLGALRHEHCII